jgi:hypothetical protein
LCHSFWEATEPIKKFHGLERFLLRKKGERPTIFFVDMEIMNTLTSSLGKVYGAACLVLCSVSGVLASDVVLQKVPDVAMEKAPVSLRQSHLGPQATFALINYSLRNSARALYVSSGNDLKQANTMIDNQAATSFGFSAEDSSPTAVIDLGKVCTVRHLSAIYSARPGSIDFYVMKSLPGIEAGNSPNTLKVDSNTFASLPSVGSAIDDGTQGRASVDFPATAGRYVMVRWIPASHADNSFTVAEIAASGPDQRNLVASSGNFSGTNSDRRMVSDSKDIADSKDMGDNKDIPEEGPQQPQPPAEGPPPPLPAPPPFTFIPQLVPTSD